ncbi:MAG TPA: NUDIX hydrolase [Burkholderiaceae bacterium]|nr:NUDIX hydrolase [Burkholderiaceae bacterium]
MGDTRWKTSVTVAAIVERDGRYLVVEEHTPDGLMLNNPAGHLDPGETPLQGVIREALEETGRHFTPDALVGVYLSRAQRRTPPSDVTFLRLAFSGAVSEPVPGRALDPEIARVLWLTPDELRAQRSRHRSPLLMRCVDDHRAGRRYPLELIYSDPSVDLPPMAQP